jgi:hypothetical protein
MTGPWRVIAKGPMGLDLDRVDGLEPGYGLLGSNGDGSSVDHRLLGRLPFAFGFEIGWVNSVDRLNNRIVVALRYAGPACTPASWILEPEVWLHYEPCLPRGVRAPACECGVDKAGVGGLHSDWCPKATP